jgi:hypothetical protein
MNDDLGIPSLIPPAQHATSIALWRNNFASSLGKEAKLQQSTLPEIYGRKEIDASSITRPYKSLPSSSSSSRTFFNKLSPSIGSWTLRTDRNPNLIDVFFSLFFGGGHLKNQLCNATFVLLFLLDI